jgi:hypothetical protein
MKTYKIIKTKNYPLYIGSPALKLDHGFWVPNYTRNIYEAGCIEEEKIGETLALLPLKPEALELVNLPE